VRVVPLGIDARRASEPEVARIRDRYGLSGDYVIWSGTIEPRKNLGGLLRAWRLAAPAAELVLVGPQGWNEDLEALVDPQRPPKVVGFVPHEDLAPLYAGARLLTWPSLLEGFGFPVLEAMAQGTPVVTSAGTATEELAEGAGILVDPRNVDGLAAAIERVLTDDELAARMSAAGLDRAATYTWDRTAAGMLDAYQEITQT
jgi:glycosyltransferase involved in cell wall biosynthesis